MICYFFMPALKTLLLNTFVPFCLHCILSSCKEEPAKAFSSIYISRAHMKKYVCLATAYSWHDPVKLIIISESLVGWD